MHACKQLPQTLGWPLRDEENVLARLPVLSVDKHHVISADKRCSGKLLEWYIEKFKAGEESAALNLIVLTAGAFDDDIKTPIVNIARELDAANAPPHQVGIQLFRLGGANIERQKTFDYLDDELYKEAKVRDIVDTVTYRGAGEGLSGDELLKVVLGAVVKKLDSRSSELQLSGQAQVLRAERE